MVEEQRMVQIAICVRLLVIPFSGGGANAQPDVSGLWVCGCVLGIWRIHES